jgi:uncharacterized protein YhaN
MVRTEKLTIEKMIKLLEQAKQGEIKTQQLEQTYQALKTSLVFNPKFNPKNSKFIIITWQDFGKIIEKIKNNQELDHNISSALRICKSYNSQPIMCQ